MAGLTTTGFVPKTLGDLRTEIGTGLRAVFGASINLDARSRFGQIRDIVANQLSTLWELGETLAGSFDPSGVNGVLLDNLCALTGTWRRVAFPSTVLLYFTGNIGTVLTVGRRARVNGTSVVFTTLTEVTLIDQNVWIAGAVIAGATVKSGGAVWYCLVGGTAAVAPTGAGPVFADGVVRWRRLGDGAALASSAAESTEKAPLQGYAGTITEIDTPVAGWLNVVNLLDAIPGALLETDAALRVRRVQEIAAMGSSPLPGILGRLLRVPGVTKVTVFENTTDSTIDGITPHGIECLVEGGTDAAIRAAIFAAKAGGIETCGNVSGAVVDALGDSHTIKFSRVVEVNIWVAISCTVNPGEYPTDGDDQVKASIVAWGDAQSAGRDAVALAIAARVFLVAGVLDLSLANIGTAFPPVSNVTVPISVRQRAVYDTSRITVATVPGVP